MESGDEAQPTPLLTIDGTLVFFLGFSRSDSLFKLTVNMI